MDSGFVVNKDMVDAGFFMRGCDEKGDVQFCQFCWSEDTDSNFIPIKSKSQKKHEKEKMNALAKANQDASDSWPVITYLA